MKQGKNLQKWLTKSDNYFKKGQSIDLTTGI